MGGGAICVIFSQRDIELLRLIHWCQFIRPKDLDGVATETERENLAALGLVKRHEKSGALVLTGKGFEFLQTLLGEISRPALPYHDYAVQRRLRVSRHRKAGADG